MGTVFKKTFTKPLPAGTEIVTRKGERLARWKDAKGKTRMARLTFGKDGRERLLIEATTYTAKYRNGAGLVVEEATGCKDETAARSVLADLERRAELVRANVITSAEDRISRHQATPLVEHFDAYGEYLQAAGVTEKHQTESRRCLDRLAADCSFGRLADLRREALERWLSRRTAEEMSARTRNAYRETIVAFCNWCIQTDRLTGNPFAATPKANVEADRRRQRRAMTEDELRRLLPVARERPLLEALTVRKGPRRGEMYANVRPEVREGLEWIGRERALIYKTLVLTGLRKGELESLTVGQMFLDEPLPYAALDAADEKNREGNDIPIRIDLAEDLRQWLADKLARLQAEALRTGAPIPARLPADTPLFNVPRGLRRILDRDLRRAGIPKRDERGRTLDVHALRTTFGTHLSKGGVPLRTAQAAMRHSDPSLTANIYTDPALLDVHGALDALPTLPLDTCTEIERIAVRATGTDAKAPSPLAPLLAPTTGFSGHSGSIRGITAALGVMGGVEETIAVSADLVKRNDPLTTPVNGPKIRGGGTRTRDFLVPNQAR